MICYQSVSRHKFRLLLTLLLALAVLALPALALAAKPGSPPGQDGLKPGTVIKNKGDSVSMTGAPYLTDPSNQHPREIALGFVRSQKQAFGRRRAFQQTRQC